MSYEKYLEQQNRVEWLYDFHPVFFEQLSPPERQALHAGYLYDVEDEDYPESIEVFYNEKIADNKEMQTRMVSALRRLHELSGSEDPDLFE